MNSVVILLAMVSCACASVLPITTIGSSYSAHQIEHSLSLPAAPAVVATPAKIVAPLPAPAAYVAPATPAKIVAPAAYFAPASSYVAPAAPAVYFA